MRAVRSPDTEFVAMRSQRPDTSTKTSPETLSLVKRVSAPDAVTSPLTVCTLIGPS